MRDDASRAADLVEARSCRFGVDERDTSRSGCRKQINYSGVLHPARRCIPGELGQRHL
jgi:hypothetical protein